MRSWRVITADGGVINGGTKAQAILLVRETSSMYLVDEGDKTVYGIHPFNKRYILDAVNSSIKGDA